MDDAQRTRLRTYAWNYFAFHADQRMKVFQFYLVVTAALIAGFVALVPKARGDFARLPSCVCFGVAFLTTMFALLDRRNAHLVKNGERALAHLDRMEQLSSVDGPHVLQLFAVDDHESKEKPTRVHISFTDILTLTFFVVGLAALGLGIALW